MLRVLAVLIVVCLEGVGASAQQFHFPSDATDQVRAYIRNGVTRTWIEGRTDTTWVRHFPDGNVWIVTRIGSYPADTVASLYDSAGLDLVSVGPDGRHIYKYDWASRQMREYLSVNHEEVGPQVVWTYDESGRVVRSTSYLSPPGQADEYFYYKHTLRVGERAYRDKKLYRFDTTLFDAQDRPAVNFGWHVYHGDSRSGDTQYYKSTSFHIPDTHQRYDTAWINLGDTDWYSHRPMIFFTDSVLRYSEARQTPYSQVFEWRKYWDSTGYTYRMEYEDGSSNETKRFFLANGLLDREERYRNNVLSSTTRYRYIYVR